MAVAPYTAREVDAFRERGDAFNRDMLQEYYDHFAGLKDTLNIERIYEEYEDVTKLETAQRLEHAPTDASNSSPTNLVMQSLPGMDLSTLAPVLMGSKLAS